MNDQTKIGNLTAAQVTAAQATAAQAETAVDNPTRSELDYWRDIVLGLDDLLRANGRIELACNFDGSVDVRCNGVATYGSVLRNALEARLSLEAARVTDKLMGGVSVGASAGTGRSFHNPADRQMKRYP